MVCIFEICGTFSFTIFDSFFFLCLAENSYRWDENTTCIDNNILIYYEIRQRHDVCDSGLRTICLETTNAMSSKLILKSIITRRILLYIRIESFRLWVRFRAKYDNFKIKSNAKIIDPFTGRHM